MAYDHMSWKQLLLVILGGGKPVGTPVRLKDIYSELEEWVADAKEGDNIELVNPTLFRVDPRYGDRSKYTHTVRAALTSLVRAGYVKRIQRAVYSLTPKGRQRLDRF